MKGADPGGRGVARDYERVRDAIAARGITLGAPLLLSDETSSTNDDAKRGAREGARHGATWVTESQTKGRGRQGRAWLSARGEDLLFSVLLRLECAALQLPPVSLVCGLAVRDAVARALGAARDADVLVKWPNDVLVRRASDGVLRKAAGVLVEASFAGTKIEHVVIGIGVNVHARALPDEIRSFSTSLALERDSGSVNAAPLDRGELLADVLSGLDRDVEHVAHRGLGIVHARLTQYDALRGREVESTDPAEALRGEACGIDLDGRLVVRRTDGELVRVASGELRMRAARPRQA